jgi:amylosucrase
MLFLANQGVEILRLDAVAFIWKQLGTVCENLPEAHMIIQAFNALARIAAPSPLFKSEAIVHPDEVARYISLDECQLSYNPLLMALLWESLATREVKLLHASMRDRFKITPAAPGSTTCAATTTSAGPSTTPTRRWVNINGFDHRRFLNAFYTGRFAGSFARGLPFQENPKTGDARISGTAPRWPGWRRRCARNPRSTWPVQRILLIHSVILSIGGIPLIYLGDEIGTCSTTTATPTTRPRRRQPLGASPLRRLDTVEGRVYQGLQRLISLRQENAVFAGHDTTVIDSGNPHVFGYVRQHGGQRVIALASFSEHPQAVAASLLRIHGLGYVFQDLVSGRAIALDGDVQLEPYQFVWLSVVA